MSNLENNAGNVAERLKLARTLMMLSQQDFATKLGVHKNTISKWERGLAEPDLPSISLLCSSLGLSPYWLINGTGPMLDKDREVTVELKPGMKAGDLRGYKLDEIRGGSAFDKTMANLKAKWTEIAQALPEGSEGADMEKAYLCHQIKHLEAELAAAKEVLKSKDELLQSKDGIIKNLNHILQVIRIHGGEEAKNLLKILPGPDELPTGFYHHSVPDDWGKSGFKK